MRGWIHGTVLSFISELEQNPTKAMKLSDFADIMLNDHSQDASSFDKEAKRFNLYSRENDFSADGFRKQAYSSSGESSLHRDDGLTFRLMLNKNYFIKAEDDNLYPLLGIYDSPIN